MPSYYDGDAAKSYYAKPRPTSASPSWAADVIAGVQTGATGEFSFALDDALAYRIYEQAGASPASTDTVVAAFEVDNTVYIPRADAPLAAGEAVERTLDDTFATTIQEKMRKVP